MRNDNGVPIVNQQQRWVANYLKYNNLGEKLEDLPKINYFNGNNRLL